MADAYFSGDDIPTDPDERFWWALAMRTKYSAGEATPKQPKFKGGRWKDSAGKTAQN